MTKITYNGKTTELADGYIATLPCKDLKMETDVVVEAPEGSGVAIAEWNGSIAYNPDAIVIFEKIYYVCIKATSAGSVVNNPSATPSEWKRLNGAYKGEYNSSTTYYLGDIVLSNNNLYQSKIDNPETAPDNDMASRWTLLHEGSGGGEQPQLYAPTILINISVLSITDDTRNGAFTSGYKIYIDGEYLTSITGTSLVLSDYMEITKTVAVTATAVGNNFAESEVSNSVDWVYTSGADGTAGLAYTLSDDGTYYTCTGIGTATETSVEISSQIDGIPVTEIGANAFSQNTNITSVIIPEGVTKIGNEAFSRCTNLSTVLLPEGLLTIGNYAFGSYINGEYMALTSITIPSTVTAIGGAAFRQCRNLTATLLPVVPPSVTSDTFYADTGTAINVIYVPANSVDVYKTATNWASHASKIQAIQETA